MVRQPSVVAESLAPGHLTLATSEMIENRTPTNRAGGA